MVARKATVERRTDTINHNHNNTTVKEKLLADLVTRRLVPDHVIEAIQTIGLPNVPANTQIVTPVAGTPAQVDRTGVGKVKERANIEPT